MTSLIAGLIILVIVGAASWYIIREKKSGAKCIGCPSGGTCGKCTCQTKEK